MFHMASKKIFQAVLCPTQLFQWKLICTFMALLSNLTSCITDFDQITRYRASIEHLQRMRLANSGCFLPRNLVLSHWITCICSHGDTFLSFCLVFGLWIPNIPRYFNFASDINEVYIQEIGEVITVGNSVIYCIMKHSVLYFEENKNNKTMYYLVCRDKFDIRFDLIRIHGCKVCISALDIYLKEKTRKLSCSRYKLQTVFFLLWKTAWSIRDIFLKIGIARFQYYITRRISYQIYYVALVYKQKGWCYNLYTQKEIFSNVRRIRKR